MPSSLISRLFPRSTERYFIAIDVGSNLAIRSLLFKEVVGKFIVIKKQVGELPTGRDEINLIPFINEYLRRLIFEYLRVIGRMPRGVLIGLGNYFTANQVHTIRKTRPKPYTVINADELNLFLDEFSKSNAEKVIGGEPYTLVRVVPFRVSVDGYRMDILSPHTKGTRIELTVLSTYVRRIYAQKLKILGSLWKGLEIHYIANQAAVLSLLVNHHNVSDALLVKIGARVTEVALMTDKAIDFTDQFEYGGDHVTEMIARVMKIDFRDAEKIKCQWDDMLLPENVRALASRAISQASEMWLDGLIGTLKGAERFMIPGTVYLFGGGSRLSEIRSMLEKRPWFAHLTFLETLSIQNLNAEAFTAKLFTNANLTLSGPEEMSLTALADKMIRTYARGKV